jgi:outer membrane protein TolC
MRRLLVLVLLLPAPAAAQAVSFDEAIALSERVPQVRATARALGARERGDRDIAGDSQGLAIQVQPGLRILSEQDRGFEGQLSVLHSWNLGNLTGTRQRAARIEREALAAEVRAEALTARLEAAHRWIQLWQRGQGLQLAVEERQLAERLAELAQRGLAGGVRTRVDVLEAAAYRADVALREVTLEGEQHDASVALAVAMGRPPTGELAAAGPLPSPALPEALDAVVERADELPTVLAARLTAVAERARIVEVAAGYAPQLGLGGQLMRESPSGFIVFGTLTLSVPLFDQGQRATSQTHGEAERREGRHGQARLQAQEMLALAAHDVEHQRREERAAVELLLPALVELVELRERALRAGEGTVFELLSDRRRLLEARARAIQARAMRTWAEVRMWILLAELARGEPDAEER